MFSKSCEYGIQATLYIAQHSKEHNNIGLKEIAKAQRIPVYFLSKVMQILVKNKILRSIKGPNGGFHLNKNASEINLLDIINAIDGMDIFNTCVLGLSDCSENKPCPIHNQYKFIKEGFLRILTNKSLASFANELGNGKAFVSF
jgi:Rrf2 family iron-sulfur cluster assembly transcriptional regulator